MISKNTLIKSAVSIAGAATLLMGFALPAFAETNLNLGANIKLDAQLPVIISRSNTAIDARITALNNLNMRIADMKRVSDSEKANVVSEVSAETGNMNSLKAKIDADTDSSTARSDEKTITGDYRIYMLVIPQGYVLAASDRISTIVDQMTTLRVKLQARIAADQSAGKDVTAMNEKMTDMSAKMQAALTAGASAKSKVASLVPDKGNATIAASNKAALVSARADLKSGKDDLIAARADMIAVISSLKANK